MEPVYDETVRFDSFAASAPIERSGWLTGGMERYRDRRQAGRVLAAQLASAELPADTVVLGLPRGGLICAKEVAVSCGVRPGALLVRKLGVPNQPELAFGAIASGGFMVLNPEIASRLSPGEMDLVATRERRELERREASYGAKPLDLEGRVVVLVDDGLATGATMRVAIQAARSRSPARVVVAVPVAAGDTLALVAELADQVVCPFIPARFRSVGEWYQDFVEVTDEQVIKVLAEPPG